MGKFKFKKVVSVFVGLFFLCIALLCATKPTLNAQNLVTTIQLLNNEKPIDMLESGVYYCKDDVTVNFISDTNIEYKIVKNNIHSDWKAFNQRFTLHAENNKVNYYKVFYAHVIDGMREEEKTVTVLIDNQKPTLEIVMKSGGEYINGVYTGQFLTYKLKQRDYNGVGFKSINEKLHMLFRTRNKIGEILTNWLPMQLEEDTHLYTVQLDNPEISMLEFKSIDLAGNNSNIRIYVHIPAGKPVIENVKVLPDKWINGRIHQTKEVIIHAQQSDVAVTSFLIKDDAGAVVCNWKKVKNFAGGEYIYNLPQGKYSVYIKNDNGLISDKYDFIVEGFDTTPPSIEIVKIQHDKNNTVYPGKVYFEIKLNIGELGVALNKLTYTKTDSQEVFNIDLSDSEYEFGGTIAVYDNITSGEWQFAAVATSGLISDSVKQTIIEKANIEQEWKQLMSAINIFNITNTDKETIGAANNFIEKLPSYDIDIEDIKDIELAGWGKDGVLLLTMAQEIYSLKESAVNEIKTTILELESYPLTKSSLEALTDIKSNILTSVNDIQIQFSSNINHLIENYEDYKGILINQLSAYTSITIQQIKEIPRGVLINFVAENAVGVPKSIIVNEGKEINLLHYQPIIIGKVFMYWKDSHGTRPVNDTIIAEVTKEKTSLVAVWHDLNIAASARTGQTLNSLKNQLPDTVTWLNEATNVAQAGLYNVDVEINVNNQLFIRSAPIIITPIIRKEYLTTQRIMEVELPDGWQWKNSTLYLAEGINTYTAVYINEIEDDLFYYTYDLQVQATKPIVADTEKSSLMPILITVMLMCCAISGILFVKKTKLKVIKKK